MPWTLEPLSSLTSQPWGEVDVAVIVSPHGATSGVYERVSGSLDDFGATGHAVESATDEGLVRALAARWDKPVISGPDDHGISVPLLLAGAPAFPVVAVTLAEATGPSGGDVEETLADARSLVGALVNSLGERRAFVACSAHTSAALNERSPVPNPPDPERAKLLESQALAALAGDPGDLAPLLLPLAEEGFSCGAGPLQVYASLFSGVGSKLLAYDDAFGVGYALAITEAIER